MDQTPPSQPQTESVWKRPWGRRATWVVVFALAFVSTCAVDVATGERPGWADLVPIGIISVIVTLLLWGGWLAVRWLRHWRNLRRALFALACLVTLGALAYAEENWRGKRAWLSHKQELEARGEKFDLAALAPPPVPDDKNLAMIPLLKPLLEYRVEPGSTVWRDTNGLARLQNLSAELTPPGSADGRLVLGSVEKGTFADFAACRDFYRGNTNYPQAADNASPAETMLVALGKFDAQIKELGEAAAARPETRFPVHYDQEDSWAILLPHLAHMKGLTRLVNVRAVAELEAGRPADALEDLKIALRLSDSISHEPLLIDHLVRIATVAINLQTIRQGIHRHAWTEPHLAELQRYCSTLNLLGEYMLAMRGERACCITGMDWMRRKGRFWNPMAEIAPENSSQPPPTVMPSGWFYQNMLTISRLHETYSLAVLDEPKHRIFPDVSEEGMRKIKNMRYNLYTIMAKMLFPAFDKAIQHSGFMQTCADEAQIACAIERYRLANGKLPETLDVLVPKFIAAVPNDVVDGKPLHYRANAPDAYILYSIGWNQRDDGGEIAFKLALKPDKKDERTDAANGDWVWKME